MITQSNLNEGGVFNVQTTYLYARFNPSRVSYDSDKVLAVLLLLFLFAKLLQLRRTCWNKNGLSLFSDHFNASQILFHGTKPSDSCPFSE